MIIPQVFFTHKMDGGKVGKKDGRGVYRYKVVYKGKALKIPVAFSCYL